ncbi:ParA family protein [Rhodopseudomonas palustris]|uniref:ParA family protein n=1 Tax=Rhodopseudomonas palustris TaxID=1076 RepID=UPI000E5A29A8|nr:ParA family protein [Rhodopseudomonas palustris]QLH71657.1 ParA family protein [Rhodopseudomonas palustris]RHZ93578.1 ParA family protein [Rhodopseudomonas palustris]
MPIIVVAQQKGGVGKTTIAINIAGELSRREREVALVDSDPQRSASIWAMMDNLEFPVYEMNLEQIPLKIWAQDIRRLPADTIIIDTAPSARQLGASVAIADIVLVPCTASGLDIEGVDETIRVIGAVRRRRKAPLAAIIVPNRIDIHLLEGDQIEHELETFGEQVAPIIRMRPDYLRAFTVGESVSSFSRGEAADREIQQLCDLVDKELARIKA